MKLNLGLVALLFSSTLWVLTEQSELSKQSELHQMFLLRDALSKHARASDFYAWEVACAFNGHSDLRKEVQERRLRSR